MSSFFLGARAITGRRRSWCRMFPLDQGVQQNLECMRIDGLLSLKENSCDRGGHIASSRIAVIGIARQSAHHDGVQIGRNVPCKKAGWLHLTRTHRLEEFLALSRTVQVLTGEHFMKDNT